jgi:predicted outer membrane protein
MLPLPAPFFWNVIQSLAFRHRTLLEEFAMRNLFAGSIVALGIICGVAIAQNTQRDTPATQPGAAGQKQGTQQGVTGGQPGQAQPNQVQPGQAQPGQVQPGQPQFGQQPAQPAQPGQPGQPGQLRQQGQFGQQEAGRLDQAGRQGQGSRGDQEIAACLYGETSNEIEIAKLAESKAQSKEVQQFAQQMVRDHTPSRDEMKQLAGNLVSDNSRQRTGEGSRAGAGGGLDWVSVKQEIGQQCLESIKKELSAKQSNEFDQCFMTQQAMAHQKMVDELTVLRNHVSGEMRQKLDKDLQTAQHHLQMAKDLAKKVSDGSSERLTRRPEGNK